MQKQDIKRRNFEHNRDRILIEPNQDLSINGQPCWDLLINNHFTLMRIHLMKFLQNAGKIIIRIRAQKRLTKIKAFLDKFKIRKRSDWDKFDETLLIRDFIKNDDDVKTTKFTFDVEAV